MKHWQNRSIEDIDGERWVSIKNYEGLYMVSSMGRIKTLERPDLETGYGNYFRETKIKKQNCNPGGYPSVTLFKDKKCITLMTHRIIALHYISNPENKRVVNHINGDKEDNRVENLEWVTHSENNYHAFSLGLMKNKKGKDCKLSRRVKQLSLDGELIKIHDSVTNAAVSVGMANSMSAISDVCNKNKYNKTCKGFKWEYIDPPPKSR